MRSWLSSICVFVAVLLLISACTTLSKQECEAGNWQKIGQLDGQKGRTAKQFGKHIDACKHYKINPDLGTYTKGRSLGLQSYCTVQHQVDIGVAGKSYNDVCPGKHEPLLIEANNIGIRYYNVKQKLSRAEQELHDIRGKMEKKKLKNADKLQLDVDELKVENVIGDLKEEMRQLKYQGEVYLTRKAKGYSGN